VRALRHILPSQTTRCATTRCGVAHGACLKRVRNIVSTFTSEQAGKDMRKSIVSTIAGSIAACVVAAPLAAQESPESVVTGGQSTFSVTPYAGYMWFGDLAEYTNTNLTNDDSWIAGAQAKIRMTSRWSVVGNFAY